MTHDILTYGICGKTFYVIESIADYYGIWFIDKIPTDMSTEGIENFIEENCLAGCSVSGTYDEIMHDFANLITDLI